MPAVSASDLTAVVCTPRRSQVENQLHIQRPENNTNLSAYVGILITMTDKFTHTHKPSPLPLSADCRCAPLKNLSRPPDRCCLISFKRHPKEASDLSESLEGSTRFEFNSLWAFQISSSHSPSSRGSSNCQGFRWACEASYAKGCRNQKIPSGGM